MANIHKDKNKKKLTVNDLVHEEKKRKGGGKKIVVPMNSGAIKFDNDGVAQQIIPSINEKGMIEKEKKIEEYNKTIFDLDPKYANMRPVSKVIVRCFLLEAYRGEGGIIVEPQILVNLPTHSGQGYAGKAVSPYVYSKRAVIVSVPDFDLTDPKEGESPSPYKPGTVVQLSRSPLQVVPSGPGKEAAVGLPYAFTHHEWQEINPPTDIANEHYGYLIVPKHEIEVFLPAEDYEVESK